MREREEQSIVSRKEEVNQRLSQAMSYKSSKSASAYIIFIVKANDTEILKLQTVQVRDKLTSKSAKVLER